MEEARHILNGANVRHVLNSSWRISRLRTPGACQVCWVGEVAIPALALGRIRRRSSHSVRVCSEVWWEHKGDETFFHDKKLIISFNRGNR
jgi:hypothetical protein